MFGDFIQGSIFAYVKSLCRDYVLVLIIYNLAEKLSWQYRNSFVEISVAPASKKKSVEAGFMFYCLS